MTLPNPFYIDAEALHPASVLRVLAWSALEGKEGVLHPSALAVSDLDTPADAISIAPGPFGVLCKHQGGQFEAYLAKLPEAWIEPVTPTDSSGPRTDLVIARVENPYVAETTTWTPLDPLSGPYWRPVVVEGVAANIQDVATHNDGWSAITLARITRPANTGIVLQEHITDLRSLAKLGGGERITIINNPPPEPPPVAHPLWTESTPVGNNTFILSSETNWKDFPGGVTWNVPIPSWARGVDIFVVMNPALTLGDWIGELRLNFGGDTVNSIPTGVNENLDGQTRYRATLMIGGTEDLPASLRGKTVPVKLQARSTASGLGGRFRAEPGTRINIMLNFKQNPSYEVY